MKNVEHPIITLDKEKCLSLVFTKFNFNFFTYKTDNKSEDHITYKWNDEIPNGCIELRIDIGKKRTKK